jgi:squalene-associated FAD-dependent desaturase
MTSEVIIVGGGLAGLAAAVALAQRGVRGTLLESRPALGGRAGSFVDTATGERIDNCQHVSMGCCTNLRHFVESIGAADAFRWEDVLYFIGPDGDVQQLRAGRWPAPLHLARAFLRFSFLSRHDRLSIARGLRLLARERGAAQPARSFSEWLAGQHQTPAAVDRFWKVVLVSALSETLDRVDVGAARKVFVDGFLAHREGWKVGIPRAPLGELYGDRLTDWLAAHGVAVRLLTAVRRIVRADADGCELELADGTVLAARDVVLAVPHHRVPALLPDALRTHLQLARVERLETAPISSVHLWLDRPAIDLPHAVLIERLSQWVFNRTALAATAVENSAAWYYQVVISASRNVAGRPQANVIDEVQQELGAIWPGVREARRLHARMVTEHRAVFSPLPGSDEFRPPQQSPAPALQLAGDWTRTGWPATMEGAVRSGYLAAENILARRGRPERLVQPDLPTALLARLLLGL